VVKENGGAGKAVGVVRTARPKEVLLTIRVVSRGDFLLALLWSPVLVALGTRGA